MCMRQHLTKQHVCANAPCSSPTFPALCRRDAVSLAVLKLSTAKALQLLHSDRAVRAGGLTAAYICSSS
jgi:hypothetical protein